LIRNLKGYLSRRQGDPAVVKRYLNEKSVRYTTVCNDGKIATIIQARVLRRATYLQNILMEPFTQTGGEVGRAIKVWKDISTSGIPDKEARKALTFMRSKLRTGNHVVRSPATISGSQLNQLLDTNMRGRAKQMMTRKAVAVPERHRISAWNVTQWVIGLN
jgi:hypothetical protein